MVYESDYGVPVIYVDGEELKQFAQSDAVEVPGYAYEWEEECVTHIRFRPLAHSFGIMRTVTFTKDASYENDATGSYVYVADSETAKMSGKTVVCIPSMDNLYSRSKGLIELGTLENKRVFIIGLGSGGASIALHLAKTGIGHFVLADFDRVELHNLSRHVCGINDLGRLKTDAIYDAIKGKNPYAKVDRLPIDVNKNLDVLDDEISKADLVLCCTDNNISRFNISESLVKHGKVGIFGRCVTRAEGGDVFIYRPGGACYVCLIGNKWYDATAEEITDLASAKRAGRIPAYVSEDDAAAVVQVGLGADIEPINNMIVKLALVELSRGTDSGIAMLEEEFTCNYYMWANRREKHYASWGNFNNTDRLPTIMKWYGVNISKNEHCTLCGNAFLGEDDKIRQTMEQLESMGTKDLGNISLDDVK